MSINSFSDLVASFLDLLGATIPLIFTLAVGVVVWKVFDAWIINADEPGKRESGKQVIVYGVIVLTIMVGIWGILALLRSTLFGI